MAEYKPLGSEKLNGDDKLKRILELTYFNTNKKPSNSNKPELVESSVKGGIYGIVKEKGSYYIKQGLNEQSLDYIGGMFMKDKNRFNSYSEAFKKLQFLKGQESLQEATKYVLKQKSPATQESPTPQPSMDVAPPSPTPDAGMDTPPAPTPDAGMDTPPAPDAGMDTPTDGESSQESKRSDYMAEIQKFSGKLGQELRDQHQKLESDDIKYVLNMIISAVDLDKLDEKDREKIAKEFEPEEDDERMNDTTTPDEPSDEEPSASTPSNGSELGEGINMLDEFVNDDMDTDDYSDDYSSDNSSSNFELYPYNPEMRRGKTHEMDTDEIDLSKYSDIDENDEELEGFLKGLGAHENEDYPNPDSEHHTHNSDEEDDIQEIDLDEIKNEINKHITSTLGKYFK